MTGAGGPGLIESPHVNVEFHVLGLPHDSAGGTLRPMDDTANIARSWRREQRSGVFVRIVEARGLGRAANGDFTLVDDHHVVVAPLLGGALDARLPALCAELVESSDINRMYTLSIDDRAAGAAGLTCAGEVDVQLQRLDTLPDELWEALAAGRPVALTTSLGDSNASVHLADRTVVGTSPTADIDDQAAQTAARLLSTPGNNYESFETAGRSVIVQCWNPQPTVIILGANALADALRSQFALLGWTVSIVEDADVAITTFAGTHPGDAVLVLEHSPEISTPLLAAALRAARGYVGALGSRKTQVVRRSHLARAGATDDEIARLHGPAGLDIGNRTPAETAVSIAAEIITFRSGRSAQPLQATAGPITK